MNFYHQRASRELVEGGGRGRGKAKVVWDYHVLVVVILDGVTRVIDRDSWLECGIGMKGTAHFYPAGVASY